MIPDAFRSSGWREQKDVIESIGFDLVSGGTQRPKRILIVGAGPVGLVLASLLAMLGIEVLVLEKRNCPTDKSMAIGLMPPTLAMLDRLGIGAEAVREGLKIVEAEIHGARHRLGTVCFDGLGGESHEKLFSLYEKRRQAACRWANRYTWFGTRRGPFWSRVRDAFCEWLLFRWPLQSTLPAQFAMLNAPAACLPKPEKEKTSCSRSMLEESSETPSASGLTTRSFSAPWLWNTTLRRGVCRWVGISDGRRL